MFSSVIIKQRAYASHRTLVGDHFHGMTWRTNQSSPTQKHFFHYPATFNIWGFLRIPWIKTFSVSPAKIYLNLLAPHLGGSRTLWLRKWAVKSWVQWMLYIIIIHIILLASTYLVRKSRVQKCWGEEIIFHQTLSNCCLICQPQLFWKLMHYNSRP